MSTEFLLTSLIIVVIPGTGTIYTVSTGLLYGWRASIAAAFGCTLGIVPHLLVSLFGLAFVVRSSPIIFQVLQFAGVLYLFYLAWNMWFESGSLESGSLESGSLESGSLESGSLESGSLEFDSASPEARPVQIVTKAVLLNLLNPKLTVFFLAFLPLFISSKTASPISELLTFSLVFMAITLIVFVLYGVLASGFRRQVMRSPNALLWLRRSFAVVFVALGISLALTVIR
jgi:threonine/homoserine/homoserine lactone efflux protein